MTPPHRKRYKNLSGNSGVEYYGTTPDSIFVWFKGRRCYEYNASRPGAHHVATMKRLAENGRGLSTYISQDVGKNFAREW